MREPTEEELRQALEEQMRKMRRGGRGGADGGHAGEPGRPRRLGLGGPEDEKDLAQAQVAIEAARALMPLLPEEQLPADQAGR